MLTSRIMASENNLVKFLVKAVGLDLYYEDKDILGWQKMSNQIANCLENHHLFAASVTGEASVDMYRNELYSFIHQLASYYGITPEEEPEPRLLVITGPILNVSAYTGRSIIVELYREKLLKLFYSPYRQAFHFRIGGWLEAEKTGREVNEDFYSERDHDPLASSYLRKKRKVGNKRDNPEHFQELSDRLNNLINSGEVVEVKNDSDLSQFLFLTSEEIKILKTEVKKGYGEEAFSEPYEKTLNRSYFEKILKELHIPARPYPNGIESRVNSQ